MKKRLTICIIGLFCLTSAFAQSQGRFLDIQLGGGLHSMQYHNLDGSNNYGGGGLFGVSYRYMFHKNWGFGVGFELNYAHATLQLDAIRQVYDAKNDKTINYTYENFFEDNNFLDLNVPVEMLFQTSINDK